MLDILNYFPKCISDQIKSQNLHNLEEIRVRAEKPIILKYQDYDVVLEQNIAQDKILEIFQFMCDNSIYSYQNQICNGFITIKRWA